MHVSWLCNHIVHIYTYTYICMVAMGTEQWTLSYERLIGLNTYGMTEGPDGRRCLHSAAPSALLAKMFCLLPCTSVISFPAVAEKNFCQVQQLRREILSVNYTRVNNAWMHWELVHDDTRHGEEILNLMRDCDLFAVGTDTIKPRKRKWNGRYRVYNTTHLLKDGKRRTTNLHYLCV